MGPDDKDRRDYKKEASDTVIAFGAGLTEEGQTPTPAPTPAQAPMDHDQRQDFEAGALHEQAQDTAKLRGCGVPAKVAIIMGAILSLLIAGFVAVTVNDDASCSGAPARRDGLVLAA